MRWSEEQTALLRKLWAEGVSSGSIAKHFGVGRGAVTGKLARAGAPKLTKEEVARRNRVAQRTRFDGAAPDRAPSHKPTKPPKPPRVAPTDPAACAATALLDSANAAQRRRDQMRSQLGWRAR